MTTDSGLDIPINNEMRMGFTHSQKDCLGCETDCRDCGPSTSTFDSLHKHKMETSMLENENQLENEAQVETFGDIDATLKERGNRYGEFSEHARITQGIKRAMADSRNWKGLTDDKREALEMLAHKIGRILNGDPDYIDSWHDIIGYTKLVEDSL